MKIRWADENARGVMRLLPAFEYRRPGLFVPIRVVAGVWMLMLTAILYGYNRGGWWGVLLIPAAAGHFYCAYRLNRVPRAGSAGMSLPHAN